MEYLILVVLVAINAFFAAAELAIVSARKTRIRQLAEDGSRAARTVLRLSDNPGRFLATIQLGVTLTGFFASAFGAVSLVSVMESLLNQVDFLKPFAGTLAFILVTTVVAFFTLIFGELVPKTLAVEAAESIAMTVARPIELVSRIAAPFVAFLTGTTNIIVRLLGGRRKASTPTVTQEEVVSMVTAGQEEGVFEAQQEELIRSVFDFSEKRVREVMRPRPDMTVLDATLPLPQAASLIAESDYSRYPVFRESRDQIVGIVFAKDVLRAYVSGRTSVTVGDLVRPPLFVPESKHVSELFTELQNGRTHMALVIDEYGSVAGLVTLEDLLEEIVGEIQDEFDHEESFLSQLGPDEYIISGHVSLGDLNEELDLELGLREDGERVDVDTLGGLVMAALKQIPQAGDTVEIPLPGGNEEYDDDYEAPENKPRPRAARLKVLEMEGMRVAKVNLQLEYPPQPQTEAETVTEPAEAIEPTPAKNHAEPRPHKTHGEELIHTPPPL